MCQRRKALWETGAIIHEQEKTNHFFCVTQFKSTKSLFYPRKVECYNGTILQHLLFTSSLGACQVLEIRRLVTNLDHFKEVHYVTYKTQQKWHDTKIIKISIKDPKSIWLNPNSNLCMESHFGMHQKHFLLLIIIIDSDTYCSTVKL